MYFEFFAYTVQLGGKYHAPTAVGDIRVPYKQFFFLPFEDFAVFDKQLIAVMKQ